MQSKNSGLIRRLYKFELDLEVFPYVIKLIDKNNKEIHRFEFTEKDEAWNALCEMNKEYLEKKYGKDK